jgi:hypothetical protein
MNYGIEYWFDDIAKIWATIQVDNKRVKSYLLNEIPEIVTKAPCAITFVKKNDEAYSRGGSATGVYAGVTEFHLTLDLLRSNMPFCMKFPDRIVAAAAAHLTLGGRVTDFHLVRTGSIEIVELTWGGEKDHFGIQVPWEVQESHTGKYTIGV